MEKEKRTYRTAVIDGMTIKVRTDQTILDAASTAGIYIPTLCHLENLEPYGACRLCVVEVKGMRGYPTACTTPIVAGMEVTTVSPALQKLRKEILEFTLSEHPYTCLVCNDKKECTDFMHSNRKVGTITGCNFCTSNGDCELQDLVDFLELDSMKFPITYRGIPSVKSNPFYDLDYNLCVLCGRCVRICNEERNSHVLAFVQRGNNTIVGTAFKESQVEAGCEFCGACVDVCPTGSISEKMGKWRGNPDRSVKTSCVICPVACDMNVNSRGGKLVQIGPAPGKRTNPPQLCLRGKFLPAEIIDHPERITTPMIRRESRWIEISWKEAFELMARKLDPHRGNGFGTIASGQDTLEDNYILQKFTRSVMRSNNVDLHYSYPDREIPERIHQLTGSQLTAGMDEVDKADTLLLLGTDASLSHPMLENRIRKAYGKGKRVIHMSSIPARTSTFASVSLEYRPGGEEELLRLLTTLLDSQDQNDKLGAFEERSGISVARLEPVISLLGTSKKLVVVVGDELLRYPSSGNIIRLLSTLPDALGAGCQCRIAFPGFEGNLYGGALSGAHPDYLPGFKRITTGKSGMTCNEMIRNTGKGGITAMMVVGDLPLHTGIDKLEFLVQCNMFRTELSGHADLLLPIPHFLESEGHILTIGNKLKKLNRAVTQPGNVKGIHSIVTNLARAMGETGFSEKPAEIIRILKPLTEVAHTAELFTEPPGRGIKEPEKQNGYPVSLIIAHNHYRYRGNTLSRLVPDLEPISKEGVVGMSETLMEQLNVKSGEPVRIVSENGILNSKATPVLGLNGHLAIYMPDGNVVTGIQSEMYPDSHPVPVKVEKG